MFGEEIVQRNRTSMIYVLTIFLMLFSACSSPYSEQSKKFELTDDEHVWLEKFFRYFMLYETAIYTLAGSKPLTEFSLIYEDPPEEQRREEKRKDYLYFLLNRSNEKDMKFYEKLSPLEKEEKAFLINDKDFIYNIEELWEKWEKIQHRFSIKKRFLLLKRECPREVWKEIFPNCTAIYDILFVDVLGTALVIQENYELFRNAVGYDFDPLEVVLELENMHSKFWGKLEGKEGWRYATLWGLLYGFGRENAFSYTWKGRNIKENRTEKEKLWAATLPSQRSCNDSPSRSEKGAFTISNFTIPIFKSFVENDPVAAKYEAEKKNIRQLYKGKDFVTCTLDLLTELPGTGKEDNVKGKF
jgi:hypothetical protein